MSPVPGVVLMLSLDPPELLCFNAKIMPAIKPPRASRPSNPNSHAEHELFSGAGLLTGLEANGYLGL